MDENGIKRAFIEERIIWQSSNWLNFFSVSESHLTSSLSMGFTEPRNGAFESNDLTDDPILAIPYFSL
jgi:hypothetical protein